jgi:hypothetical protein
MKDLLKIVNRAVKKKGGVFANIRITDGVAEANNGRIAIRATVPELAGITATVPGDKLMAALNACKGTISVKTTAASLMVKSGSFSARIPLVTVDLPEADYAVGEPVDLPQGFPSKLSTAATFASEDFDGVLLRDSGIYGLSEGAFVAIDGAPVPGDVVLPLETVADIAAIKEQPTAMRVSDNFAVLDYASFQLRTQLVDKRWPDVDKFLQFDPGTVPAIGEDALEAVKSVLPFADHTKRVTFLDGAVLCGEAEVKGVDVTDGAFSGELLQKALTVATGFEVAVEDGFTRARFMGDGLRGVLAGMK